MNIMHKQQQLHNQMASEPAGSVQNSIQYSKGSN